MLRQRHLIDASKLLVGPFVLALMASRDAWASPTAWVYLGVHGTYGVMWALKSAIFGDRSWEAPARGFGLLVGLGAFTYWLLPWLLIGSGREASPPRIAAAIAAFGLGTFLHFAADMQKTLSMELAPGTLLTTRLWARTRNPNYLGELLIYGSFVLLVDHWLAVAWVLGIVAAVWTPFMLRKERSLARYPAFAAWKARSGLLIPWPFGGDGPAAHDPRASGSER